MTYQDLGLTTTLEQHRLDEGLDSLELGRVILEHKERYVLKTPTQEFDAELIGNLRYSAKDRLDFPAVGDWVAFMEYDEKKALIQAIYPRQSIISRNAIGKVGQIQIIATNIDVGLIVQAVDRDFNLNRLERYLTICHSAGIKPIVILSKIDLINVSELERITKLVSERIKDVAIVKVSNTTIGYSELEEHIVVGKTYCLLGSSGVGKSTILNGLLGKEAMSTGAISNAVNKGKHTTTHRELIVLPNGGILIDNPGMREVGISDSSEGLEMTFDSILEYAEDCKFKDCSHTNEKGCAILEALDNGGIDEEAYENFQKLERESTHFASNAQERKKKDKDLGKMIKAVKKHRKNTKY